MPHETYQPIACSQYDLYEIAIMRGQPLDLVWCDDNGLEQQSHIKPLGLETRAGEEFLLFLDPLVPGIQAVRLDRIRQR